MSDLKRKRYKKKRYVIPITLIVLLIAIRLSLPYIVKNYVNNVLADIPGYYGQVEDIDLSIIRGAYTIHGMYLNTVNGNTEVPFLDFKETDISIEWNALFNGRIVSEIEMREPTVIYIFEDQQDSTTQADAEDWTKALTDLVPIDINRLPLKTENLYFYSCKLIPT
mgnify:FL=1